ncbi:MAG: hypothetical protein CL840_04980 [Crocinitomicaceae bacterium]|nr:hypothetical protein [Crocinitomicaceae bacterium]
MEEETGHIIRSYKYQIVLDDEKEARSMQSTISLLQESKVNSLLEKVMDHYDDKDSIYQFNDVELDLGTLAKSNFENNVLYRIEEELHNFFAFAIQENGNLRTGKRILLRDHKLEQFAHFLEHGYFKWDSKPTLSPSNLLTELIKENSKELVQVLHRYGKKEIVRKRMVLQLDEKSLENIVHTVAKNDALYIVTYKKNMLERQQKERTVNTSFTSFRNAIWEVILAYLFVDSNSYYGKKNFLHYLIARVAEKYNLTYKVLLNLISQGVESEEKLTNDLEFRKVIRDLTADQEKADAKKRKSSRTRSEPPVIDFLKQVDFYLENGTFSHENLPGSSTDFNHQLLWILRTNAASTGIYILKWMNHLSQKMRFISLLNDQSLNELAEFVNVPFITDNLSLFDAVEIYKDHLDNKLKSSWKHFFESRGRLVLSAYRGKSYSGIDNNMLLIKYLIAHFDAELITQIIIAVKEFIPASHKKGIEKYLRKNEIIDTDEPKESIDHWSKISNELLKFTKNNEIEMWYHWISRQLPDWLTQTDTNMEEFLTIVKQQINQDFSGMRLLEFLESVQFKDSEETDTPSANGVSRKTLENVNPLILKQLFKEVSSILSQQTTVANWNVLVMELIQKTSRQYHLEFELLFTSLLEYSAIKPFDREAHSKLKILKSSYYYKSFQHNKKLRDSQLSKYEIVSFIILKGVYPWWIENYSQAKFNTDFASLWKLESNKKKLLDQIRSSEFSGDWLNHDNQKVIWKTLFVNGKLADLLGASTSNSIVFDIYKLIEGQLIPVGIIQEKEYRNLQDQVFHLLIQKKKTTGVQLLELIKSWLRNTSEAMSDKTSILFYNLLVQLEQNSEKPGLKKEYENLRNELFPTLVEERKQEGKSGSLEKWLSNYYEKHSKNKQILSDPIHLQLEYLQKHASEQFISWLAVPEFRQLLLSQLKPKETIGLVKNQLNSEQQLLFTASLKLIESIKIISVQEFDLINGMFLKLTLLKIGTGGIELWNETNWAELLYHILVNTLGQKKALDVSLKMNEHQVVSNKDPNEPTTKILNSIHARMKKEAKFPRAKKQSNDVTSIDPIYVKQELEEDKPYKKLGEEEDRELLNPMFTNNAGLILLAPFLGMLFEKCGLTTGGIFITEESKHKATHILEYAATGKSGNEEPAMIINKLLCGIPIGTPVERKIKLSSSEKQTIDSLLYSVTQQWSVLKGTSIDGLRSSFLQRDAKLEEQDEQFFMIIEQKPYDMLLDQIPWNIKKIKLSWMEKLLEVEWRP